MTTPEERAHACAALLEPQGMGYARQVIDEDDVQFLMEMVMKIGKGSGYTIHSAVSPNQPKQDIPCARITPLMSKPNLSRLGGRI